MRSDLLFSIACILRSVTCFEQQNTNQTVQMVITQSFFNNLTQEFIAPALTLLTKTSFGNITN